MDNDLEFNDLSDTSNFDDPAPGPVDAQDLMEALEPDFLENELPLDEEGRIIKAFEREDGGTEVDQTDLDKTLSESMPLSGLVDELLPEKEGKEADGSGQPDAFYAEPSPEQVRALKQTMTGDDLLESGFETLDPETLLPSSPSEPLEASTSADPQVSSNEAAASEVTFVVQDDEQDLLLTGERGASPETFTGPGRSVTQTAVQHLQRSFDATDLLAAQSVLRATSKEAVPLVTLLGLAAERALSAAPGSTVTLARLAEETLTPFWTLPQGLSLREALTLKKCSVAERSSVFVVDLSDLELDGALLPNEGLWLSLLRLTVDPMYPGQTRGVLNLSGQVGLKRGAGLLKAVSERLESPFSLAV